MSTMVLDAVKAVAVAKAIKDDSAKALSATLVPGEYKLDFTVRVAGSLKKGEDYDKRVTIKADPWFLLAAALSHLNGVTVASLTREAVNADPALAESIKVEADKAIAAVKAAVPPTRCTGMVKVDLDIVEVL